MASALAIIGGDPDLLDGREDEDGLVAYLVAAHHGKIRVTMRSLPDENIPEDDAGGLPRRFACGVWDGDRLPDVALGGGVVMPSTELSLAPMEMGSTVADGRSWTDMTLGMLEDGDVGPFRLALLEAMLRVADWRASAGNLGVKGAEHS